MGSKDTKTKAFVRNNMRFADVCNYYLYDGINYSAQVAETYRKNKENKNYRPKSAEFLSGFGKNDKLVPVITITIYWGAGKWDGPRSLHEMFDTEDETILKYAQDYKVNLIIPDEIEDFGVFATDMGYTLDCIKHSGSKEDLMGFFEKNEELHYWQREIK